MSEHPTCQPVSKDTIQNIVNTKAWYGLNPQTGSFNFMGSVQKMAAELIVDPREVKEAITSAFGPSCLTQVVYKKQGEDNKSSNIPLLMALRDVEFDPHIWTVGDVEWQRTKYEKTGAAAYIPDAHFHCYPSEKLRELEGLVTTLTKGSERSRVIVVDDKWDNVAGAKRLMRSLKEKGVEMVDYHMKLSDPQADATAFFTWVLGQKREALKAKERLELIMDFDGVVADTDGVMMGPVVEKLYDLVKRFS